jgi:hypothetical protein
MRVVAGQENIFGPDLVRGLQEKFRFVEVPVRLEELDTSKGASFRHGAFNGAVIELFQIYDNGILADSKTSTEHIDEFIDAALAWAAERFHLTYSESTTAQRRGYVSQIEVTSQKELFRPLSKLKVIGELIGEKVTGYGKECPPFQPSGFHLSTDFNADGTMTADRFVFEYRGGIPFGQNTYYSTAPLATQDHMRVLKRIEEVL